VASFDSATALGALGSGYYGNPNSGYDPAEAFAYLNFVATGGTIFDTIVFNNPGPSGFEADNFGVLATPVSPPPGTPITGGITATSEPATLTLMAIGLAGIVGNRWRRK